MRLTKNRQHASAEFRITSSAEEAAYILRDIRDPKETHKYTTSKCIEVINKWIKRDNLNFASLSNKKDIESVFNMYHLNYLLAFTA